MLQELLDAERKAAARPVHQDVDIDDLLNDPDLEKLHAERLAALQQEVEKRAAMQRKGHGSYEEVAEGDFMEIVTKTPLVVAHFFHRDFERCRVMDRHLTELARTHFDTRFIKISAPVSIYRAIVLLRVNSGLYIASIFPPFKPTLLQIPSSFFLQDAPFFTEKLQVRLLPCILSFVDGIAVDRVVGFDELGGKDDFPTSRLEARLEKGGAVLPIVKESEEDREEAVRTMRQGFNQLRKTESDEDSDFD